MTSPVSAKLQDPGNLKIAFQPVFELGEQPNPIYALQATMHGPTGTCSENGKWLLQQMHGKNAEPFLDRHCLRLACEAMLSLPENVLVHIPVHASTLAQDPAFVVDFHQHLHEHKVDGARVTIDLEDFGRKECSVPLVTLDELRRAGVRVNLNGVGFADASWRILMDRPPEFWTLSAQLADCVGENFRKRAAVESILGLATRFGCSVIAREIGRQEDLTTLAMLGVRLVQADFLCPAISLDQLLNSGVF